MAAAIVAEVTVRRDRAAKKWSPIADGSIALAAKQQELNDLLDWLDDWGKT